MANALTNAALPAGWLRADSPEYRQWWAQYQADNYDPVMGGMRSGVAYQNQAPMSGIPVGDNSLTRAGAVGQAFNPENNEVVGLDASGNPLWDSRYSTLTNDDATMIAGLLAGGAVGSAVAGAGAAGTTAASTGGGAAAGGAAGGAAAAGGGGMSGDLWGKIAGGLISGAIQSSAANSAAKTQAGATQAGIEEQRRQYDQTREDFTPWREAGQRALGSLEQDIGRMPTPEEVMADPGYQFGMGQGMQAIDRRLAAIGGRRGGAAAKAGARFATDYASTQYGAAYQRRQDRLNRLAALAGIGQTATGASAAAGQNATNAITGLISSQGDAAAANRMYQGNIWGNVVNQGAAAWGRSQKPQWQPQQFGQTWQQQGGPMDYGSYGEYGNLGGP